MQVVACGSPDELARRAAGLLLDRLRAKPDLVVAVPAGRTPRAMFAYLAAACGDDPRPFARMRVFAVDELCPPASADGYFWGQIQRQFLAWARVPLSQRHPFRVAAPDLAAMCRDYEDEIRGAGGLDLVMLGLGPNGHLASNEPGSALDSRTRPVDLTPETVAYILTDPIRQGPVSARAVSLGLGTILETREVVALVAGAGKRRALAAMLSGPVTPALPASVLRHHRRCTVLAGMEALAR